MDHASENPNNSVKAEDMAASGKWSPRSLPTARGGLAAQLTPTRRPSRACACSAGAGKIRTNPLSLLESRSLKAALLSTLCLLLLVRVVQSAIPEVLPVVAFDRCVHVLVYGVITVCFLSAVKRQPRWVLSAAISLGVVGIGTVDELTQPLTGGAASSMDFLADLAGVIIAYAIFLKVTRSLASFAGALEAVDCLDYEA
jgi:VanZ family protein